MTEHVNHRISVCVRKRPMNKTERNNKEGEFLETHHDHLVVYQPRVDVDLTKYSETQDLRFDYVFGGKASTERVYKSTAQPLVKTVFERNFPACFAFGQTGSGKTHTMNGDCVDDQQSYADSIYAMTANDVLKMRHYKQYSDLNLTVSCSFFEVDGARVHDLLKNKAPLRVLEADKKIQVVGMDEVPVACESDVLQLIEKGTLMRTTRATTATYNSSKSHAIFQIILRRDDKIWGKFSLIDLASDEFDEDSSSHKRSRGGGEINKSLLALKECIRAMASNNSYVPFRNSKLTLVLRDSFVGAKNRICLIVTISPGMSASKRTMSTLRYAHRIKTLVEEREISALKKEDGGNDNTDLPQKKPSVSHEDIAAKNEDAELGDFSSQNKELSVSTLTAATNDALNIRHILDQCMERWIEEIRVISSSTQDNEEKLIRLIISANRMSSGLSKFMGMLKKWQELREQKQRPQKGEE